MKIFKITLFALSVLFFTSCNRSETERSQYYISKQKNLTILAVRNVGIKLPAQEVYVFNGRDAKWYSVPFSEIDQYKVGDSLPAVVLTEYIYVKDTINAK